MWRSMRVQYFSRASKYNGISMKIVETMLDCRLHGRSLFADCSRRLNASIVYDWLDVVT